MRATLADPPRFRLSGRDGAHVVLESDQGFAAHLFVLEDDIIRVALLPGPKFSINRTWSIAPGEEDVAEEGRDRFDTAGFSKPSYELESNNYKITLATQKLRLSIATIGFHCTWEMMTADGWRRIARDRASQAYNFGWWGKKVYHYLARAPSERYYGLGERSGDMDRALRRFRLKGTDAMGYSAKTSDPLYKHIPFYITSEGASAFGLFYDTYADCEFDFGAEIDNYHGPYRSFVAESGDLDYYVIAGPTVADVTRRFTWLTGRPLFPPRWSLGYSGSTMSYTDAPDAQAKMAEFIEKCRANDILCDSFHLSSGYSSIGARRHVFHWNREKFPEPAAFSHSYHEAGVRLCANIKPCLLADNSLFEDARKKRLIVCDASGEPAWTQFWDGLGAYVDFTNPDARMWWIEQVKANLLAFGIDATWNDNNEYEILSPDARAHGWDGALPAHQVKPLQSLLMMKCSRDAQREFAPENRPFLVSRSGSAGMQRYAQTWSGDNTTSWETLRYNIKMGMGLALSGVSNSGHDVGGFAGPAPDSELFVRWVEAGIFMPRFTIHSWNSDGTANEPWMHAEATKSVRALIHLRHALIPYLYGLMWRYRSDYEPVWRPTLYDFPDDPNCRHESDTYMLGPSLLVAPVCEEGQRRLAVTLPAGASWAEFWSGQKHVGGEHVEVEAPLGRPVLFARVGHALPMNIAEQHFDVRCDERAFAAFPPDEGEVTALSFEDDGESEAWRKGRFGHWNVSIACTDRLSIKADRARASPPKSTSLAFLFRPNEKRPVETQDGKVVLDLIDKGWRKVEIRLKG